VTPGSVLSGLARTQSFSSARFWSAAAAETVRRAAAEKSLDLLQVEYQQMVPLAAGIHAKTSVLDLHNVESALVDSYAQARRGFEAAGLRAEAVALRRMERRTIKRFDHVAIVSEQERKRLPEGVRSVLVCPNGRDPSAVLPPAPDPTVAFVATMGWRPNIDAALWLGRDIWPLVVAQVPQARLLLVGRDPAPSVLALARDNLQVTGTVPDVTPYLAESRVVVAPLRAGGGTRLKLMEALDVGRPVVATSVGCEGAEDLVGRGVVVADTAKSLADAIASLLLDPARASELGQAGHDAVSAEHTWDRALAPLLQAVRAC
jgi:glycosyltransferase involved in cell wall biosynthesis